MSGIDWGALAEAVRAIGGAAVRGEGGLSLRTEGGFEGTIRSLPAPAAAAALRPVGVLLAESIVPAGRLAALGGQRADAATAAALNRFAGAAAAMADGGDLRFTARVTLYEGDAAAWPLHARLLAYAAVWGPTTALAGAQRLARQRPPNDTGASAWTGDDLAQARAVLPKHLVAILDPPSADAITANVPLGADRPPARLEVRTDVVHPLHGPGLFANLILPIQFRDAAALGETLAALNALEAEPIDAPPHYGAWGPGPAARAGYAFFLPNGVKLPVIQNLVGWFALRARLAAGVLAAEALAGGEDGPTSAQRGGC